MGIKEDIAKFKSSFDEAVDEIESDILALKKLVEEGGQTPSDVALALEEMAMKLEAVKNIYNPPVEVTPAPSTSSPSTSNPVTEEPLP